MERCLKTFFSPSIGIAAEGTLVLAVYCLGAFDFFSRSRGFIDLCNLGVDHMGKTRFSRMWRQVSGFTSPLIFNFAVKLLELVVPWLWWRVVIYESKLLQIYHEIYLVTSHL